MLHWHHLLTYQRTFFWVLSDIWKCFFIISFRFFYFSPQLIENEKGVFIRSSQKIHKLFYYPPSLGRERERHFPDGLKKFFKLFSYSLNREITRTPLFWRSERKNFTPSLYLAKNRHTYNSKFEKSPHFYKGIQKHLDHLKIWPFTICLHSKDKEKNDSRAFCTWIVRLIFNSNPQVVLMRQPWKLPSCVYVIS